MILEPVASRVAVGFCCNLTHKNAALDTSRLPDREEKKTMSTHVGKEAYAQHHGQRCLQEPCTIAGVSSRAHLPRINTPLAVRWKHRSVCVILGRIPEAFGVARLADACVGINRRAHYSSVRELHFVRHHARSSLLLKILDARLDPLSLSEEDPDW